MEADRAYFERRASEEKAAAAAAADSRARQAHAEMACRYDDLVAGITRHEQKWATIHSEVGVAFARVSAPAA